jgi:hypothetical protein
MIGGVGGDDQPAGDAFLAQRAENGQPGQSGCLICRAPILPAARVYPIFCDMIYAVVGVVWHAQDHLEGWFARCEIQQEVLL